MSTTSIRVLVVEDSLTIRKHLVEVLSLAPGIEVVGEAADGKSGIEQCQDLQPDVVTMDMMLPIMTGVAATEFIMAYCPTPILVVSASSNRGEQFRTYEALAAGAVDVLDKPNGDNSNEVWELEFVAAVRMVSRIRVITHLRGRGRSLRPSSSPRPSAPVTCGSQDRRLVAIGASTGGPGALRTLLGSLPENFNLPILLVLHISEPFGDAMAAWLDAQQELVVRYAIDGERLPEPGHGCVLMAPPDQHLELVGGRLRLGRSPERHSCRPSVDVLFESLAREMGPNTIAGLLTGMGKDGAQGLLAIRRSGGLTLAQDEASSVVFGMPGEAIKIGAAEHVLALSDFGAAIGRLAAVKTNGKSGVS